MARDRVQIRMRVTGQGLAPADPLDGEFLSRYPVGSEVSVSLHRKPAPGLLRLLWALAADIYPSTKFPTADALMTWLKVRLGHVDEVYLPDIVKPRSLGDFEHEELVEFMQGMMIVLCEEVVPGLDIEPLMRERVQQTRRRA